MMVKNPIFFWLSMGALALTVCLAAAKTVWVARAERTIGEVTSVTAYNARCKSKHSRYSCTQFSAVISYMVNEVPYSLRVGAGHARDHNRPTTLAKHRVGQRVKMIFDPHRPASAFRNTFYDLYGAGALFFLMHLSLLVASFREPKSPVEPTTELGLNRTVGPLGEEGQSGLGVFQDK